MTDRLILEIRKIEPFSDEEIDMLQGWLVKKFIRKGDHFLNMNQVSRHIAFIDTGLMMHYSLHDGVEIPCNFSIEGDWISSLKSFTSGSPTEVAIKALEDTWIGEISGEHAQQLFLLSPRWLLFKNHLVKWSWTGACQRANTPSSACRRGWMPAWRSDLVLFWRGLRVSFSLNDRYFFSNFRIAC